MGCLQKERYLFKSQFIRIQTCLLSESGEDEQHQLDLILAPTNLKDFQVEVVLKSTNTALEFTSDLLEPTSKRSLESTSNLKRNLNFINQYLIKDEYKIKNTRTFYRLTKEYYSY